MSKPAPRTVLFDFDGTITRYDSSRYAVVKLILAHPLRTLAALYALPVCGPLLLSRRTEALAGSLFVWIASTRRTRESWLGSLHSVSMGRVVTRHMNGEVLRRLRAHLHAGDRVYVVTGSATPVARSICERLELDVPVIGSQLQPFLGGYVSLFHCIGPRKVERLQQLHGLDRWDLVYSDSHRDLPMMQRAREVVLVNPGRNTLRRVRAELPASVRLEVLRS